MTPSRDLVELSEFPGRLKSKSKVAQAEKEAALRSKVRQRDSGRRGPGHRGCASLTDVPSRKSRRYLRGPLRL